MVAERKPEFEEVYKTCQRAVTRFLWYRTHNIQMAEDLAADTFIRAFRSWDRFNPELNSPRGWLLTIARNLSINEYNQRRQVLSLEDEVTERKTGMGWNLREAIIDRSNSIEDELIRKETIDRVRKVLMRLPPNRLALVEMRYYQHMPYKEISEITGQNVNTLKVKLFRIRQTLRRDLKDIVA